MSKFISDVCNAGKGMVTASDTETDHFSSHSASIFPLHYLSSASQLCTSGFDTQVY